MQAIVILIIVHVVTGFPAFRSRCSRVRCGSLASAVIDLRSDVLYSKCDVFMDSVSQALVGNTEPLQTCTTFDCGWSNPIVSNYADLLSSMLQFSRFFSEPVIYTIEKELVDQNTLSVSYQLSFWYPLPWRPRIMIPATARIQFTDDLKVCSVVETWKASLRSIFWQQMIPRWWDVWHVFSSFAPECPPSRRIATIDGIEIIEMPAGVVAETTWCGLAKYPGPPILTVPGFSLPGKLKSARPRREPYVTTMPVEVQSYRYRCASSGEEMKRTVWQYRLPSNMQYRVYDKIAAGELTHVTPDSLLNATVEDEGGVETTVEETTKESNVTGEEVELRVGFQNLNVMKSITGGRMRNTNFTLDRHKAAEFENKESISFMYKAVPKRTFAVLGLRGEVTGTSITKTLEEMKSKLHKSKVGVGGKTLRMMESGPAISNDGEGSQVPLFTLQLWDIKACFNAQAEPSMAVYEMQYGLPSTKLLLEVELT